MIIKQVSVFLENKSGRLNEVTSILGDASINISAFTIADTSEFGILRLIVSDPEKAESDLKKSGFSVQITNVVLVKSPNRPGGLAGLLKVMYSEEVFIEYMYAFSMEDEEAVIVIRPDNVEKCMDVLWKHKDEFLLSNGHYKI